MNHPWRQTLHVEPKTGWLNDPNGLCDYDGVHQLYYQSSPEEPGRGREKMLGPPEKFRLLSLDGGGDGAVPGHSGGPAAGCTPAAQ